MGVKGADLRATFGVCSSSAVYRVGHRMSTQVTPTAAGRRGPQKKTTPQVLYDTPEPYQTKKERVDRALEELSREDEREYREAMERIKRRVESLVRE